jgi:hypothetical protein
MTIVGRAQVRIVGANERELLAFVRVGIGDEHRVRGKRASPGWRWRCDACPGRDGCTHAKAVEHALAAREARKGGSDEPTTA